MLYTVKTFDFNNDGKELNQFSYDSMAEAQRVARGASDETEIGLAGIYDEEEGLIAVYLGGMRYDRNELDNDYVHSSGASLRGQLEESHTDALGF